jgi:hypothetical protein
VTRLTRQDPVKNLIALVDFCFFFFLLKRRRFDFKKNDPGNPVTRSKPGTRALDRAGSKNYGLYLKKIYFDFILKYFILNLIYFHLLNILLS